MQKFQLSVIDMILIRQINLTILLYWTKWIYFILNCTCNRKWIFFNWQTSKLVWTKFKNFKITSSQRVKIRFDEVNSKIWCYSNFMILKSRSSIKFATQFWTFSFHVIRSGAVHSSRNFQKVMFAEFFPRFWIQCLSD